MTKQALLTPARYYDEINEKKKLSGTESSLRFNVLTCTRQETPPEWGKGEAEYLNQLVLCFTDDHLSKN